MKTSLRLRLIRLARWADRWQVGAGIVLWAVFLGGWALAYLLAWAVSP